MCVEGTGSFALVGQQVYGAGVHSILGLGLSGSCLASVSSVRQPMPQQCMLPAGCSCLCSGPTQTVKSPASYAEASC